jgi:glycosyltransferase involved in cell wall biosynthesis
MRRFAGVKDKRIFVVSDSPLAGDASVQIPEELDDYSSEELLAWFRYTDGKFVSKKLRKPAKDLRIALVGNWRMQCGISSYSENLWPKVAKLVGEVKLFIERNDAPTGPFNVLGDIELPESSVVQCWKRGESLGELSHELREYDPDIVWIQHEFGIWPNARFWLALMSQLSDTRVIVTMHSVFHHRDKTIVEAAMQEIVVHLEGAKTVLEDEKGIRGKVTVIPHGCYPCVSKERLWNFYRSPYTFMQFGFGFRYKGWEESIKATAILKEKYPDVFFTGVFSESPFSQKEHQVYYEDLAKLVESLGLQDNVAIVRGFQSDEALDSFLRTNQATVFPYVSHPKHEVFGASGAARLAMSKAIPVVTSQVNHFSDLPTLKGSTPEQIAEHLDKLFSDPKARKEQIGIQLKFVEENSWDAIAARYAALFEEK